MVESKKLVKLLAPAFLFFPFFTQWDWTYPTPQISKQNECKFIPWSQHDDDCIIDLPVIEKANYDNYKHNTTYRRAYTVLWWATYDGWWDVWQWWHAWVDIASAKWTPVLSMWDWRVEQANYIQWWWNTVVISHDFQWSTIHSVYAHLSEINASEGSVVSKWDKVWEMWTSWNSRWNHLHFQIDTNRDWNHPWNYGYHSECEYSYTQSVNQWACRDLMIANTTDPIKFLETNGASLRIADTEEEEEEIVEETKQEEQQISRDEIQTREEIMLSEFELFQARFPMELSSNIRWNTLSIWESWSLTLSVEYRWRPFDGSLPMDMEIQADDEVVDILPKRLIAVNDWERKINIEWVSSGTTSVVAKIRWKIIWRETIRVVEDWDVLEANRSIMYNIWTDTLGDMNWWLVVMQDQDNNNIVSTPYEWSFTVSSNSNSKLCDPEITSRSDMNNVDCWPDDFVDEITFNYNDTLEGLFLFKIKPTSSWQVRASTYKNWERIGITSPSRASFPRDINSRSTEHYSSIIWGLENGYLTNYRGASFAPNHTIREGDAADWIEMAFRHVNQVDVSQYKRLTRMEFMQLLSDMTWITARGEVPYRDVEGKDQEQAAGILEDFDIHLDQHFPRYFGPNNGITRGEAAHIIYQLETEVSKLLETNGDRF